MKFLRDVARVVVLAVAMSCVSLVTTVVLVSLMAAASWFYYLRNFREVTGSDDPTSPPPRAPVFQLHEAVVMRQLVPPGEISTTWADIGGCCEVLRHIREQVIYPLMYACSHRSEPLLMMPKGVLLYGPPGCGKTLIAKAIAKEVQTNFLNIDVSTVKNMWVGETEKMAAAIFSVAYKIQPCIIFLDEVDTLLNTRNNIEGPASMGLKAVFLQMWDGLLSDTTGRVMVLAATNRLDAMDEAFLRRLPLQFEVKKPSAEGRYAILSIHLQEVTLAEDVDLQMVVEMTDGFSGSDLQELCRCAATRRLVEYMEQLSASRSSSSDGLRPLTKEDFMLALDLHRLNAGNATPFNHYYL